MRSFSPTLQPRSSPFTLLVIFHTDGHTLGSKTLGIYSLTAPGDRARNQGVRRAALPPEALEIVSFQWLWVSVCSCIPSSLPLSQLPWGSLMKTLHWI